MRLHSTRAGANQRAPLREVGGSDRLCALAFLHRGYIRGTCTRMRSMLGLHPEPSLFRQGFCTLVLFITYRVDTLVMIHRVL